MRIVREGISVGLGQVASALGALVGIRLLTEFMQPATFGTLSLLMGVAVLAQGFSTTPLTQSVLRFYPACANNSTTGHLRRISVRAVLGICAAVGVILLVGWYFWRARYGGSVWTGAILAVMLMVDGLRALEVTLLNAARRQSPMALWIGLEAWLRPLVAVLVVFWVGESAESVLVGYLGASLGLFLLFRIALGTIPGLAEGSDGTAPRESDLANRMTRYALPLVPLALVGWISAQADRYLIGGMIDLAAAGIYSAMYGLVSRPFLLAGTAVELTLRPVLYQAIADGNEQKARLVEHRWLYALVAVSALGTAGFMLLHQVLSTLLLAESYRDYSYLMPWLAVGYSFLVVAQFYERLCYARDKTAAGLTIQTAGAIASIIIAIPLVSRYGIEGAAVAVPCYFLFQMMLARAMARKAAPGRAPTFRSDPRQQ